MPFALASSSNRLHVSTMSGSNSESPIGLPCAAKNVKHIAPPITIESTMPSSASTTPSLSEIFAPPSTATNGCSRLVAQAEQDVDLLLQQPPHRRRHELRRTDDRCVGAVRGAERVVDVAVDAVDELWPRTPGRWPSRPDRTAGSPAARRPAPARRGARAPAPSSTSGSGAPFGRPRWLARDDVRAALGQPLDRRQRGADAEVVGDRAVVVERDVEVGADQDPLAAQVAESALEILQRRDRAHSCRPFSA